MPVPWDDRHVFYVWYDALINYLTAIGYGDDEARFEILVAGGPPSDRQGDHPVPLRVVAGDVHGGGNRPACPRTGARLVAGRWARDFRRRGSEEANDPDSSPIKLTEISPDALTEDFGVDAIRYHLLRAVPLGTDGDFSYEGITARYNSDLANNLGNLSLACRDRRRLEVRWHRAGARSRQPSGRGVGGHRRGVGRRLESVRARTRRSKRRGGSSARRTPSSRPRSPGRPNLALRQTPSWEAHSRRLRIVALLVLPAMPTTSAEIWSRIGLAGAPEDRRLPADAAWGGYPGGVPVVKGDPLFPRRKA